MFTPIGYYAEVGGGFLPSYSPFAYYDGLDTTNSVDSVNKTWSDIALVNTTDDSTFDTDVGGNGLPTWNSNGYWEIRSDTGTNTGQAFRYSTNTNTTNPFSFITNDSFTTFQVVRLLAGDNDNDLLGSGNAAGAAFIGTGDSFGKVRGITYVTATRFLDTDPSSITSGIWYVTGLRFTRNGSSSNMSMFISTINGTVDINTGGNFTAGTVSSTPNEMSIGGRGGSVFGNADHAAYALYKSALSDSEIQDVVDELSDRFGNPT